MKLRYLFLLSLLPVLLAAQTNVSLKAHYNFEGNLEDATGNTANTGTPIGTPSFGCGVQGLYLIHI